MSGIGTITAAEMFTEQVGLKPRTTDPSNAEPGEYWIRTDQTSTDPQVVAELRRQDTDGVTAIPLFDESEEANLGSGVVRGPSIALADGTVGFVAQTTDSAAAYGSPRVVTAAGEEYLSHNLLTLSPIPDSVVNRWPFKAGSGTTAEDVIGTDDGTINGASWVSDTTYIEDNGLGFSRSNGDDVNTGAQMPAGSMTLLATVDDDVNTGAQMPAGSMTLLATVDFDADITSIQYVSAVQNSGSAGNRLLRFHDGGTNRIQFEVANDSGSIFDAEFDISSTGRYRVAGILDPSSDEVRVAVDGTVEDTTATSGNFSTQLSNHQMGERPDKSDQNNFDHEMDEPMVANEAYTSSQLTDDFSRQPWS